MDENTPTQKPPFAILQQNLKQRNREVWHCRKQGSQIMVHILLCGCKMYRCIKHQSMSCSLKPKLHSGAKALWIRSQWNTHKDFWIFFPIEGWLHPNQQMTMLVIVRKHFERQSSNEGISFVCKEHQKTVCHLRLQFSFDGVKRPLMSETDRLWLYAFTSSIICSVRSPLSLWHPNLLCKAMAYLAD